MLLSQKLHQHRKAVAQRLLDGRPGPDPEVALSDLLGEHAYRSVLDTKKSIGLSRIRMGALLCAMEDSGTWMGKTAAKTFRRFLIEEGIEPTSAYQYMEVGRRFVLELKCSHDQLDRLASASMRTLAAAAKVATATNLSDVIDIVTALPRPEAIEALQELRDDACDTPETPEARPSVPRSTPVNRIMDQFGDLTMDQQAELYGRLGMRSAVRPKGPMHP